MPVVLLIRHAQASYGAENYDVLSDDGHRQAPLLDACLADRGVCPALVMAGTAIRQQDTARLCERTVATRTIRTDPRWNEYDTDAVLSRYADHPARLADAPRLSSREFQLVLDNALEGWVEEPDGGKAFARDIRSALESLARELGSGETALVFTSAGTIAAACCAVLGLPQISFIALNRVQVNTGITKLVIGASGTSLVSFNEHGHLEGPDGSLVTYR